MSDRLRQTLRLSGLGMWTLFCYALWLPGAALTLPFARAHLGWNGLMLSRWSAGLLLCLGVRVVMTGSRPPKPFFLAANHLGYLDVLVLGAKLGGTFVSKHDVRDWPVLGHLARVTGTIFVNRDRRRDTLRVLKEIDRAVDRGAGVVIFPEGTSSRGDGVLPLKTGLLEWAARRQFPVHAATLRYETGDPARPAADTVCWWGDMTFVPHFLEMLQVRRITATLSFRPHPVTAGTRSLLASRLTEELTAGLAQRPLPEAL